MDKTSGAAAKAMAQDIVHRLREHGHQAWLVGGCVRDELLGIVPKDYDVATSARPDQMLPLFPKADLVGAHFGVLLVKGPQAAVEVATFRSDVGYEDGRHPDQVVFETNPRQDVLRRDFAINALLLDPDSGEVLDFVGGQRDLHDGIIRAIGDPAARFEEDHLRMLRAVRFAARFRFAIEPETMKAIHIHRALIHRVSAERIRDEMLRILTEGQARRGIELLDECGLLSELLPEVKAFQGVQQPPEFHPEGDVWTHVMLMLEQMGKTTPALALGVLLHDIAKPPTFRIEGRIRFDGHAEKGVEMAREILSRWKCSNDLIDEVCALVGQHMRFKDVPRMKQSTIKKFLRQPGFEQHMELHRLDCLSSNRNLDTYNQVRQLFQDLKPEELRPPRLISGDDLIACGYPPGPKFSEVLSAVEDAQLEGSISTSEEALELVKRLFAA